MCYISCQASLEKLNNKEMSSSYWTFLKKRSRIVTSSLWTLCAAESQLKHAEYSQQLCLTVYLIEGSICKNQES